MCVGEEVNPCEQFQVNSKKYERFLAVQFGTSMGGERTSVGVGGLGYATCGIGGQFRVFCPTVNCTGE